MSIGYLRKWSDPGAPKLWANQFGSLTNLLKAVLVDGYGDTPGLGWTLEYESPDLNTKVFRNDPFVGSGVYFRVAHSNLYTAANYVRVALFESMVDYDNGLLRTPPVGASLSWNLGSSVGAACDDGIHWMIVGDNRGFWLAVRYRLSQDANIFVSLAARSWHIYYLGDIIPIHPGHPFPSVIMGKLSDTSSPVFGSVSSFKTVTTELFIVRGSSFKAGCVNVGFGSGSNYEPSFFGFSPTISPLYGRNLLTPITIHDSAQLIGFFPGGRNVLRSSGIEEGAAFDEEFILSDQRLHTLLYRHSTTPSGCRIGIISGKGFRDVL